MNSVVQLRSGRETWPPLRPHRALRMRAQPDIGPILANAPVAMLLLGLDLQCLGVNEAMAKLAGRPSRALSGRTLMDVFPEAVRIAARSIALHMAGHAIPDQEIAWRGRRYCLSANPVWIPASETHALIVAAVDVTRHHRIQQRLRRSRRRLVEDVRQDHLTGLLNRRALDAQLSREIRIATRDRAPLSVLIADIDWFKAYNDKLGHPAGDACLRAVAEELRRCMGQAGGLACRYGGEEFVAILPNMDGRNACIVAERFRAAVAALSVKCPSNVRRDVTVSIGVVSFQGGTGETPTGRCHEALLAIADEALYCAKANGRNQVRSAGQFACQASG